DPRHAPPPAAPGCTRAPHGRAAAAAGARRRAGPAPGPRHRHRHRSRVRPGGGRRLRGRAPGRLLPADALRAVRALLQPRRLRSRQRPGDDPPRHALDLGGDGDPGQRRRRDAVRRARHRARQRRAARRAPPQGRGRGGAPERVAGGGGRPRRPVGHRPRRDQPGGAAM
ncbi:MAG: hypothetical protein AVDCRST_MAG20-1670, partial [uncultured Acidimicrobiales bacterium]